jgi:hypothetical protein
MNKPQLFRKKPEKIQAMQWNGKNKEEIKKFCDGNMNYIDRDIILIFSRKESFYAFKNDWIIKDPKEKYANIYKCNNDDFIKLYEMVC